MARAQSKWAATFADNMQDLVGAGVDDEVAAIRGKHAADVTAAGGALSWVRLSELRPSPDQPRVSEDEIEELAAQIAADGLLQAPQVRRGSDGFVIVFGHRRIAALRRLAAEGLDSPAPAPGRVGAEPFLRLGRTPDDAQAPVRVVEIDDLTALKRTVSENLARLDLAAYEQVVAVAMLKRALNAAGSDASLRSGLVPALGLAKHKVERPHYVAERLTPEILVAAGMLAADESDLRRAAPELRLLSIDALRRVVDAGDLDAQVRALRVELARIRPREPEASQRPPRAYGLRIVVRGDLHRLAPKKAANYAVELAEALGQLLEVAGSALTDEQATRLAAVAPRLSTTGLASTRGASRSAAKPRSRPSESQTG
jgi:ParB-like chromosome segregation protein Spo0J